MLSAEPKAGLITLTKSLIIYDITKTESNIIVLLYIVLKKITIDTPSQGY